MKTMGWTQERDAWATPRTRPAVQTDRLDRLDSNPAFCDVNAVVRWNQLNPALTANRKASSSSASVSALLCFFKNVATSCFDRRPFPSKSIRCTQASPLVDVRLRLAQHLESFANVVVRSERHSTSSLREIKDQKLNNNKNKNRYKITHGESGSRSRKWSQ